MFGVSHSVSTPFPQEGADAATAETLERWRALICETFVELRPESPDPRFRGQLASRQLGGLTVSRVGGSPQMVRRGAPEIRRSPGKGLFLIYQAAGAGRVEHDDGAIELGLGDCVLVHPDRPYVLGFNQSFRQVCVEVPEGRLRERNLGPIEPAFGRPMAASRGVARVLGAATRVLATEEEPDLGAIEIFLDVLARSLGYMDSHEPALEAAAGGRRLQRFIAGHFRVEGLAPADAAAALGCSVRNVHKTCQSLGTTFGRMLLEERLAAASRRLASADPSLGRISDVAYDCGFGDVSHFSRTFKSRFGVSPRIYRRHRS